MKDSKSFKPRLAGDIQAEPFDVNLGKKVFIIKSPSGRQFQVSEQLYMGLCLMNGKRTLGEIAEILSTKFDFHISADELFSFLHKKIAPLGLLEGMNEHQSALKFDNEFLKLTVRRIIVDYKILRPISKLFSIFLANPIVVIVMALSLWLRFIVYEDIFVLFESINPFLLPNKTVLFLFLALFTGTLFHEFGHLAACHRNNCKHGSLGIGLYFFMPVFYVDISDAWRLPKKNRFMIDIAGVYFQLIFVLIVYIIGRLVANSSVSLVIIAIDLSIIANLNPILKFDGYWALSDLLGIPNLHQRMLNLIKSIFIRKKLREFVDLSKRLKLVLVVYSALSVTLLGYWVWLFGKLAPKILFSYPESLISTVKKVIKFITTGRWIEGISEVMHIAFPTFFIVAFALLLIRVASYIWSTVRKYNFQWNSRKTYAMLIISIIFIFLLSFLFIAQGRTIKKSERTVYKDIKNISLITGNGDLKILSTTSKQLIVNSVIKMKASSTRNAIGLKKARVIIEAQQHSIFIKEDLPDGAWVDYLIEMPTSVNSLKITMGNGDALLRLDNFPKETTLSSINGDIQLLVKDKAALNNLRANFNTLNGNINFQNSYGNIVISDRMKKVFGDGQSQLSINTVMGDITVRPSR